MLGDIPYGYCQCGCGEKTKISPMKNTARGYEKGKPRPYLAGHWKRSLRPDYIVDDETGCWVWQKFVNHAGYGRTTVKQRKGFAHRVYYEQAKGPIPEGLHLDHLCRNTRCVNPDHLEPVTPGENVRRSASTKLSWAKVEAIRTSDLSHKELAAQYGVAPHTIYNVRIGARWKVPNGEEGSATSPAGHDAG